MKHWGKHLIINAKSCDIEKARDPIFIANFVRRLVKVINMVPYGEPQVVHFADGTDKAGWTVIQLIETSNIIGHFLDHNGDLYLDVFSCKKFDDGVVNNLLNEYFKPEKISATFLFRQA